MLDRPPEPLEGLVRLEVGVDERGPAAAWAPARRTSSSCRALTTSSCSAGRGGGRARRARGRRPRAPSAATAPVSVMRAPHSSESHSSAVDHPRRDERRACSVGASSSRARFTHMSFVEHVDPACAPLGRRRRAIARVMSSMPGYVVTPTTWPGWTLAPSRRSARPGGRRRARRCVHGIAASGIGRPGRVCDDNGAMRLNAYLARAGVASRRGADELIKAGRVTVNGARGELEHVRRAPRPGRGRRPRRRAAGARLRPAQQAGRGRHDGARPAGAADRRAISSAATSASCPSAGSTATRPARCC